MASLAYLYQELNRINQEIQSTQDLLDVEDDEERRYRYQVTLQGLEQAKSDVEESIQREEEAAANNPDQY